MRSALLQSELVHLYAIDELRVMRRETVLYARMFPPGERARGFEAAGLPERTQSAGLWRWG
jgi:hypothetical protein